MVKKGFKCPVPVDGPTNKKKTPSSTEEALSTNGDMKTEKFVRVNFTKPRIEKKKKSKDRLPKVPQLPLKLNKRMRRELREAEVKALTPQTDVDRTVAQESLSCNWNLLQKVFHGREDSSSRNPKRRRDSSSSVNISSKRPCQHSATEDDEALASETDTDSETDSEPTSNKITSEVDDDAFIVPIIRPSSPGVSSSEEDSDNDDGEEAVEMDMDLEEEFIKNGREMEKEAVSKAQHRRQEQLQLQAIAMDCEMVGVGVGGSDSALARVSIVDRTGKVLYDKYVKPVVPVTDFRTQFSGIRPENLVDAPSFKQVQQEVHALIDKRMLVGHALRNDLHCLSLSHPIHLLRDTSVYSKFRAHYNQYSPSLKNLSKDFLGVTIQEGEHDSAIDAHTAMRLYVKHHEEWEAELASGSREGHFTLHNGKRFKTFTRCKKRKPREGGRFAKKTLTHGKQKC